MSNIGLNFNNISSLASLAQMFGGTNNGSSAMVVLLPIIQTLQGIFTLHKWY